MEQGQAVCGRRGGYHRAAPTCDGGDGLAWRRRDCRPVRRGKPQRHCDHARAGVHVGREQGWPVRPRAATREGCVQPPRCRVFFGAYCNGVGRRVAHSGAVNQRQPLLFRIQFLRPVGGGWTHQHRAHAAAGAPLHPEQNPTRVHSGQQGPLPRTHGPWASVRMGQQQVWAAWPGYPSGPGNTHACGSASGPQGEPDLLWLKAHCGCYRARPAVCMGGERLRPVWLRRPAGAEPSPLCAVLLQAQCAASVCVRLPDHAGDRGRAGVRVRAQRLRAAGDRRPHGPRVPHPRHLPAVSRHTHHSGGGGHRPRGRLDKYPSALFLWVEWGRPAWHRQPHTHHGACPCVRPQRQEAVFPQGGVRPQPRSCHRFPGSLTACRWQAAVRQQQQQAALQLLAHTRCMLPHRLVHTSL
mmetsp:Transcript_51471/g.129145  ORF Transcript_51471/g.129145 Transcript_51471/m.129145 type:complete len:410 (+) Transcript_51471:1181-2410(+)